MCEIDSGDREYAEVWCEPMIRARKPHRCVICYSTIQPGSTYCRHFSLSDGTPWTAKICGPCQEIRADFSNVHGFSPHPIEFREYLSQCIIGEKPQYPRWLSRWLSRETTYEAAYKAEILARYYVGHRKWRAESRHWRVARVQIKLRTRAEKRRAA